MAIPPDTPIRVGIESEFWVLQPAKNGYAARSIRNHEAFVETLKALGGEFEYAHNQFELRTVDPHEEQESEPAERELRSRLQKLHEEIPDSIITSIGTYQGSDEPPLDLTQSPDRNGQNAFWIEFNIAFPSDALTRYTAADQFNMSIPGKTPAENIGLYNRVAGLAPVLTYAFSTSPAITHVPADVWNRRQQLIIAKRKRSGTVVPGTYPLENRDDYYENLEEIADHVERVLAEQNPTFFCRNGNRPRDVVAQYRGREWDFYKLCTDQSLRYNWGGEDGVFLEARCIDAQEAPKLIAALSTLARSIGRADGRLDEILPPNERALNESAIDAIHHGPDAHVQTPHGPVPMPEYARMIRDVLFGDNPEDRYATLLAERFEHPPATRIRELVAGGKDLVQMFKTCLLENKTVYEA